MSAKTQHMADLFELPLPENLDAERFILGSILNSDSSYPRAAAQLTALDFSLEKHRRIFLRMGELYEKGVRIDRVTLAEELQRAGQLASVDGLSYIVSLDDGLPVIGNLEGYVGIVREKAIRRQAIEHALSFVERCYAQDSSSELLLDAERVSDILRHSERGVVDSNTVEEIIEAEGGLNAFLSPEAKPGIHIPFDMLHKTLGGLRRGKFIVLGARPASGKTALATQIAEHAAENGKNVVIVSLEMRAKDLLYRSIAGRARVSSYEFRRGELGEAARNAILRETEQIAILGERLRFADKAEATVSGLNAMLRTRRSAGNSTDLLIIDYLQLVDAHDQRENRVQEVSAISRGLKRISLEYDIPVLALSQLSRKGSDTTEEPQLHWLRDSGQIEQDADQVIFLWPSREPEVADSTREIRWKVAKNRDGMLNHGRLTFQTMYCRFVETIVGGKAA